jgi:hypothetical protein
VAFTAATVGYLHRRRHRPGDTGHIAGMGGSYVVMLTAFYVDKSTEVIHNFGRADQVDRAALARLVASISR